MNRKKTLTLDEWGMFKRLMEHCYADPVKLHTFLEMPEEFLAQEKLALDASGAKEAVEQYILHKEWSRNNRYRNTWEHSIRVLHERLKDEADPEHIRDPAFRRWYLRQLNRCFFQSRIYRHMQGFILIPIVYELSDGCSVGCPFCCLNAGKLRSVLSYKENAALFREVLFASKEVLGDIAGAGGCYFATEPLDNRDYEFFIEDFYKIFGRYPQTTTAAADRDLHRTEALLQQIGENELKRTAAVRFSITSLRQLEKIHGFFTPEALAYVELLPNNKESLYGYCNAGRAVSLAEKLPDKKMESGYSPVCVNGFVVNLCNKTIRLVTPCLPDEETPLGMREYGSKIFRDGTDFAGCMHSMIGQYMSEKSLPEADICFYKNILWKYGNNRLRIRGDGITRSMSISDRQKAFIEGIRLQGNTFGKMAQILRLTPYETGCMEQKMKLFLESGYIELR